MKFAPGDELRSHQSFPVFKVLGTRKSWLERTLSLMADVRAGEGATVLLLTMNAFLLLGAYYVLKTVREALILTEGGAEVKSYSAAGQAALLLLIVPLYSRLAALLTRIRLVTWVPGFFILNLLVFYALGAAGWKVGVAFFLWVGVFNVFIIAQFWAFANDLYSESQGKRLFPIIALGSSLGAFLGAQAAGWLVKQTSVYGLMLIAAATLAGCVLLNLLVSARESGAAPEKAAQAEEKLSASDGFALVFRNRYLLLIAILMVLLNVVNTTGEFLLGKLVTEEAAKLGEAERKAFVGGFYGEFFGWVNLASMLAQGFLVSRIYHYVGVRGALFVLPLIALSGYTLMLFYPLLAAVRIVKIAENATDYSIQNTTRQALYLPTSRDEKYKAKAAIDSFFWRAGDLLQAGIVFAGTAAGFGIGQFAAANLVLTVAWLAVAAAIGVRYDLLTRK